MFERTLASALCALLLCAQVSAQQSPTPQTAAPATAARPATAVSIDVATDLTNGWALLADGKAAQAAERAARVLRADPRSIAGLNLAIEAELARSGVDAALAQYERWLGNRSMEEPGVVRRIAQAVLHMEAAQRQDMAIRLQALRDLAAAGDTTAEAALAASLSAGSGSEARILAARGNQKAISVLIADLRKQSTNAVLAIDALGQSGSRQAIPVLLEQLSDTKPEVRGSALSALGKLGDKDVIPQIKPFLGDERAFVRTSAAGALYRLGDDSGLQVLQELMSQPVPSLRLAAADAMSSRPDGAWLALVRELTSAPDAEVRASAARLIAPHDPALAASVLEPLLTHENPVIRDLAADGIGDIPLDLTTLRRLMRDPNRLTRVRAAGRVLVLTK